MPATLLAKIDAALIQGLAVGINNCRGLKKSKPETNKGLHQLSPANP